MDLLHLQSPNLCQGEELHYEKQFMNIKVNIRFLPKCGF